MKTKIDKKPAPTKLISSLTPLKQNTTKQYPRAASAMSTALPVKGTKENKVNGKIN